MVQNVKKETSKIYERKERVIKVNEKIVGEVNVMHIAWNYRIIGIVGDEENKGLVDLV